MNVKVKKYHYDVIITHKPESQGITRFPCEDTWKLLEKLNFLTIDNLNTLSSNGVLVIDKPNCYYNIFFSKIPFEIPQFNSVNKKEFKI